MSIQFQITDDREFSGAIIFLPSGQLKPVSSDHPAYDQIKQGLFDGDLDEEQLLGLINPAEGAGSKLRSISERVSFGGGKLYFDGDVLDNAIAEHILKIINSGSKDEDYEPLVKFLENLYTNPSEESRQHLYHFIQANGMTITEDGFLLAYKGVRNDGTSVHAGYGIVNGEVFEHANLLNEVGSVIEIPRSMVDTDRGAACSVGLHVGAHVYASSFSQRLLTVVVNPRDVVSVPSDANDQKVRVARYTVIGIADEAVNTPTYSYGSDDVRPSYTGYWDDEDDADEDDWDEDESDEDEPETLLGVVAPPEDGSRIEEYKAVIPTLVKDGVSLRRYKSKNVTAGRRGEFIEAARQLGYEIG